MREKKSSKKIVRGVTIRFADSELARFKRAAAAERRSFNAFVILACEAASGKAAALAPKH